ICAPTPLQWGVARALEVPDSYYKNLAADYQTKRDILADALSEAGFRPSIPEGSYYMLAAIPDEFHDDREAADSLLENARVASVPGSAFFVSEAGKKMLRFCFAKDFASLEEACKRIRAFSPARIAK
ncbi:MAG TPA: aminotransferase class I/II-fold pyridoxal phosphate-dependent enzyme, partial [Thermoanaerobaculia bacterium]